MKFTEARRLPVIVNLICFTIALLVAAVLLLKPLHSVRRGFFCDDHNIRYPYKGETITVPLLIVTCFLPTVIIVIVLETTYGVFTARHATSTTKDTANGVVVGGGGGGAGGEGGLKEGVRTGLSRAGLLIACLFYGNCLCFSLTEVFKLSFGTLRPCFLSACRPLVDVTSLPNCSSWFVQDIVCQGEGSKLMIEMRKSFISGHASFAVYNMFFVMLYLQRRLPLSTPRLVVSLLQCVGTGYAILVCASRIYDHYHHPPDVMGGALLGVLTCWVTMFKICPAVIRHPPRSPIDLLPSQGPKQGTALQLTTIHTKE
ncbi:phospholipid phosphatase 3-like [Babylonia areolata]|uniref:phospholipid phosphatase 3-like n=1 Tax=Babylonia areolata TaxID=304850 RepID=UPI003FD06F0F